MKREKFLKLKGRIVQIYGTQDNFSKALGKSDTYATLKLNGHTKFRLDDIKKWVEMLDIKESEIWEYFFC